MAGPEVHHLFHHPIADHSFSADRQTLAVARDNNVELYGRSGSKFSLQDELKGHDKTVTGVDIAPESGRIVTCSQGRLFGYTPLVLSSDLTSIMFSTPGLLPSPIVSPTKVLFMIYLYILPLKETMGLSYTYDVTIPWWQNPERRLTFSTDRNAYVWEPSPSGWKPTLVLLRINRAATFVRWSPSELKFAVGSGARVIAVCSFEEENDWWVSKLLKKPIRSTITTVAWHPNSVLLAAGSTDAHARVFSSFIKGVDARPEPSVWGEKLPFNTVCGEYLNHSGGWVQGCAFSPSGNALAFTAHDSSVTVVYPSGPDQDPKAIVSISTQLLPFLSLIWNGEDEMIAAGYVWEP